MLRQRLANEATVHQAAVPIDEARGRLLVALDRLPSEQRELLMAYYWDELKGADCAALAGCSVGAVWVRLHRARAALRLELDELKGD